MTISILKATCLALALSGCTSHDAAPALSTDHPANPAAAQTPFAAQPNVLAGDAVVAPSSPRPSHQHVQAADSQPPQAHAEHQDNKEHAAHQAASAQDDIDKLFTAYLAAAERLSKDDFDGAAKQFGTIHHMAHNLSDSDNAKLVPIADRIAKAAHEKPTDIKALRESFKAVSPAVVELVHAAPPTQKVAPVIRQAWCPMAKAPWLQTGEKVANPYFGSEMLGCGKITETITTTDSTKK